MKKPDLVLASPSLTPTKKAVAGAVRASTFNRFFLFLALSPLFASVSFEAVASEETRLEFLRSVVRGFHSIEGFEWSQKWECLKSKETCPSLVSCEHAFYMLLVCGHTSRDCDADGVPCEQSHCSLVDDDPCWPPETTDAGSHCTCVRKDEFFAN